MPYPESFGAFQNMYPQATGYQMGASSQQLPRYQVAVVEGEKGALDFPMGPNSSIILADKTNKNRLWFCTTDELCFKKVRPLTSTFDDVAEEETELMKLSKRMTRLEDMVNERLNTRSSKSKSTADTES